MRRKVAYAALTGLIFTGTYAAKVQPVDNPLLTQTPVHTVERAWPTMKVMFVGDMMFDRTVRSYAEKKNLESLFECAAKELKNVNAVIGNLEGPITSNPSVSVGTKPGVEGNTSFTFSKDVAKVLFDNNVKVVSLANNHMRDFGKAGIIETRNTLDGAGVAYFGDPNDLTNLSKRIIIGDIPIILVAFNQFLGGDPQKAIDEIKKYSSAERVVVFAHWGDEYKKANDYQKKWAHAFVDAGADLVIGAHPHVAQEVEIYNDAMIFYSLGNFIFDQYWNEDVRKGLGVIVTFGRKGVVSVEPKYFVRDQIPVPCPLP